MGEVCYGGLTSLNENISIVDPESESENVAVLNVEIYFA